MPKLKDLICTNIISTICKEQDLLDHKTFFLCSPGVASEVYRLVNGKWLEVIEHPYHPFTH